MCDFEDETCHPSPCQNGGTCQSRKTHGRIDWSCMCPARYTGSSCQHEVSCECLYGDCNADGVHCNCYPGYTGTLCETDFCLMYIVVTGQWLETLTVRRSECDSQAGQIVRNLLPTARHCCNTSSQLCFPGVNVPRFGEIPRVY